MTQTQRGKKVLEVLTVLMALILDVFFKPVILKVYICYTRWVFKLLRVVFAILKLPRTKTFEFHNILCQSARLIAEDIVHHSQFFIQV